MQQITIQLEDSDYQSLVNQFGKENLNELIIQTLKPYTLFANKAPRKAEKISNTQSKGAFDEFFGILKSDKSVSIEDMNEAIRQRGGKL